MSQTENVRVCIVGAGFSGLAAAIELRRSGITDLVILERAGSVGGAWRDNTYPGCACDVKSRLFELRAAPWPDWSRAYSGQDEIRTYLQRVVEIFGLEPHLRLETELISAQWDGDRLVWHVETSRGDLVADVLISACGGLTEPLIPDIAGAGSFRGKTMHTARWDHDVDLASMRVAVIGTGASAIQVIPALAPDVDHLVVCQRTPAWVLPRNDHAISVRQRDIAERGESARVRTGLRQFAAGSEAVLLACMSFAICQDAEIRPSLPLTLSLTPTGRTTGALLLSLNEKASDACPLRNGFRNCRGVTARITMSGTNYVARFNSSGEASVHVTRAAGSSVNRVDVAFPRLDVGGPFRLQALTVQL